MNNHTVGREALQEPKQPKIASATDEEIVAYLRHSYKIAEIATLAERNALILKTCQELEITVSDEELQAAGDAFRREHRLLGGAETLAWLSQQRISVEDWTQGIRIELFAKKLKEHLFGEVVDAHYMNNRQDYKRVALSQILVRDLADALKIVRALREENASFCALALEFSKGKQSKESGGFMGIRFLAELMPEIAAAIAEAKEGEVLNPIQTQLGYHIIKIEKWFPAELSETLREQVLDSLFQAWLHTGGNFDHLPQGQSQNT
jgi:parvulin-like peptidyl-prolyl isomerase